MPRAGAPSGTTTSGDPGRDLKVARTTILPIAVLASALLLAGGVAYAAIIECKTGRTCTGTKDVDRLLGTSGQNFMYGKGEDDKLYGYDHGDYLFGQGGNDRLFGGPSEFLTSDYLYGGPGNDQLNGGEQRDVYTFEGDNWGKDTINDPDTSNMVQFVELSAALTITLIPRSTDPEVTNAAGTSRVNWSTPINEVNNLSTGDDKITGNLLNNRITSSGGFDEVRGDLGNDSIDVADGSGGDVVYCGEDAGDNDSVTYDAGTQTSLGDFVFDCERTFPE